MFLIQCPQILIGFCAISHAHLLMPDQDEDLQANLHCALQLMVPPLDPAQERKERRQQQSETAGR